MFINKFQFFNASIVFNLSFLVLRAVDIPTIKKYRFLNSKVLVIVSSPETTAKTAGVRVEGQMAKWNQKLGPL